MQDRLYMSVATLWSKILCYGSKMINCISWFPRKPTNNVAVCKVKKAQWASNRHLSRLVICQTRVICEYGQLKKKLFIKPRVTAHKNGTGVSLTYRCVVSPKRSGIELVLSLYLRFLRAFSLSGVSVSIENEVGGLESLSLCKSHLRGFQRPSWICFSQF